MMSEQHSPAADDKAGGSQAEVVPEVRTRRLAVVDEAGVEQAVLQVRRGVMEVSVGGGQSGVPCQVVIFAGEDEPGHYAAGIEIRANGDSVGGAAVTVVGSTVEFHRFGEQQRNE